MIRRGRANTAVIFGWALCRMNWSNGLRKPALGSGQCLPGAAKRLSNSGAALSALLNFCRNVNYERLLSLYLRIGLGGHPDKMSDQISDAILDTYLTKDPDARVAVETLVKTGMVVVAGEVTTSGTVTTGELEEVIRQTVLDIGFDSSDVCFDGNTCAVINAIGQQSADIALGTHEADEANQGAGDQGLMFGFASDETDVLMPAPIHYSHRLVEKQAELRKSGLYPGCARMQKVRSRCDTALTASPSGSRPWSSPLSTARYFPTGSAGSSAQGDH